MGRDVGHFLAVRSVQVPGQLARRVPGTEQIARRVAFAAVAQVPDQIGAAIPDRGLGGLGRERPGLEEQRLPDTQQKAEVERKRNLVPPARTRHRRECGQIGLDVQRVARAHAGVGGVGERRIVVAAVRRPPLPERGQELGVGPAADAVLGIGGDVGGIEAAERRLQRRAAANGWSLRLESPWQAAQPAAAVR